MFGKSVCILLSGKAGVGKTTSADILKEYFAQNNLHVVKESFATGVKQVALRDFGWDGKKDQKGRRLLQRIGQAGREYDINIWVDSTLTRLAEHPSYPLDVVLIDDWRFPNEEERIKSNPLYSVYTIRIHAPSREILKGTPEYDEVSEVSLDEHNFDVILHNEGDIDQLKSILHVIFSNIYKAENTFGG